MSSPLKENQTTLQQTFSYQYIFKLEFWIVLVLTIALTIGMLYYAQDYSALSPFIRNPQDLILPLSEWARQPNCAPSFEGKSAFFVLDIFFSIGISLLLGILFFGFFNKKNQLKKEEKHHTVTQNQFIFSWPNLITSLKQPATSLADKWLKWGFVSILALAFLVDEIENVSFYFDADLSGQSAICYLLILRKVKITLFGLAIVLIIYRIIHGFFKDHYPADSDFNAFVLDRVKYALRYFYPSFLGMVVLAYILNTFNAFDSLILEVLNLPNFLIFMVLFAGTILTVWFIPYYLRFSKTFYEDLATKREKVVTDLVDRIYEVKKENNSQTIQNLVEEDTEQIKTKPIDSPLAIHLEKEEITAEVSLDPKKEIREVLEKQMNSNDTINAYFLEEKYENLYNPIDKQEITEVEEKEAIKEIAAKKAVKSISNPNTTKSVNEQNKKGTSWNAYQKILINGLFEQARSEHDYHLFHNTRRFLAYFFIMILLSMEGQLLDNLLNTSHWQPSLVGTSVLSMAIYMNCYQRSIILRKGEQLITISHLIISIILAVFHLIATLWLLYGIWSGYEWFYLVIGLLVNTFLLPFSFMGFSLYRRSGKKYKFVKKVKEKTADNKQIIKLETQPKLDNFFKDLSYKSLELFMPIFLRGTLLTLGFFFFLILVNINIVECLNPLNLFLIFFNGILTLIAVLDRYLTLVKKANKFKSHSEEYKEEVENNRNKRLHLVTIFSIFLLLLIATRTRENHYHDVDYYPISAEDKSSEDKVLSLSDYTYQFLAKEKDTTEKEPIILIASDGGGLRAAYWTLLVMNELDSLTKGRFSDRIFLTTGISGGGIGLSMYTYQKAKGMTLPERRLVADKIGSTNFLSGDMAGIFGRGLVSQLLPTFFDLSCWEDRAEAMAKNYFNLHNEYLPEEKKITFKDFKKQPFHTLWTDNDYKLPLHIVNTARTEDGARGVVHPLTYNVDSITAFVDLVKNYNNEYISYPDAAFLTNRFPFMSPSGRIEGKGHFVDGGYLENSGLSTLAYYLQKMYGKATHPTDSIFQDFRERKIIVLSIANDKSTYIQSKFANKIDSVNQIYPRGEISSIIGASASTGTTALPAYFKKLFSNPNFGKQHGIDTLKFLTIQLPYRFNTNEVHKAFYGQIADCSIPDSVNIHNDTLLNFYKVKNNSANSNNPPINMPPLGRLLPENTREYMKTMLEYTEVRTVLDSVATLLKE